jgi:type II secretory pathway pseudopilin PulG
LLREREAQERARREAQEQERQLAQAQAEAQAQEEARQQAEAAAQAQPPAAAASAPEQVASAPASPASAPAMDAAALDRWPTDTRLNYTLSGQFRGPLFGDARVQWQRQGEKYQVRLDVSIQLFGTQVLTSQGEVTPEGLVPRAYEELRPGKRRVAQLGDQVVVLENGRTVPRPPGVQDTASQFVELSQRFATGREVLEVGRTVSLWLARPGGVDQWTYDIAGREMLRTPRFGTIETFHLKPRAIDKPRGNITAEMWFAPSLQYLPVRIKVLMGDEAYLDLLVDQIEQR